MIEVLRWEWRYCRKGVRKQLLEQACYPAAVLLLYYFHKEWLFQAASVVLSLPEEIYAFLGLNHSVTTGNIRFYVLFGVMPLQIWVVWNACWRTLYLLQADERTGSIYILCNQWYSKRQLGLGKLTCSLIATFLQNTSLYVIVLIVILLGSTNMEQRLATVSIVMLLWFRSSIVAGMLISLTFAVGVFIRQPVRKGMIWVNGILAGTLLLGNIYKVRDLLQWFLNQVSVESSSILRTLGWLDKGYLLSPISWLNPYRNLPVRTIVLQSLICAGITIVGVIIGLKGYKRRRIEQML